MVGREKGKERERREEKRQREEIVLKTMKLEEVTCVGRKGTEPGTLMLTSGNIWVTGNVSGELKIRMWISVINTT